jgi:DNA-directed RNA polymerase specialized sigma24 family protein
MGEGIKRGDVLLFDSEIIDLFNERSEKAIMELSKKYGSVCRKVARNILNNDLDAEECVNDAFLGAWNTIPPQNPNPLLTYICRIVRNLSIKKYHANTAIKRNSFYDAALDEEYHEISGLKISFLHAVGFLLQKRDQNYRKAPAQS